MRGRLLFCFPAEISHVGASERDAYSGPQANLTVI